MNAPLRPKDETDWQRLAAGATPSMRQYFDIKAQHPESLLFFRMGDFYELFFEDAVEAAAALDIALTKRGKHQEKDIPMCGVPVHAAEGYLRQLTKAGFRVAVCEQMEDPKEAKKRGSKAVVRREVVRLVTPGTLTEDALLDARSSNYLMAFSEMRGKAAIAWIDLSTGVLRVAPSSRKALMADIARIRPAEIALPEREFDDAVLLAQIEEAGVSPTPLGATSFDSTSALKRICAHYQVKTLEGFGQFSRPELSALGAIFDYIALTQVGQMPYIAPPRQEKNAATMRLDAATRRNLELVETMSGERGGALLGVIDHTITGAGARLLADRLAAPLLDVFAINARLDAVGYFHADGATREQIRTALRNVPDVARALTRVTLGRAGPRDLASLRDGLREARALHRSFAGLDTLPPALGAAFASLTGHESLVDELARALAPDLPLLIREGGFIAQGYDASLDELRALARDSRSVIAKMEGEHREETGISSLKIKHNNVLGYFIEVTPLHADKLMSEPLNARFIHRQTLANATRFTTTELSELDMKISRAGAQIVETEKEIFARLCARAGELAPAITASALALAEIDVAAALAELAAQADWTRPVLEEGVAFAVSGGRHPVVEAALRKTGAPFIANDCDLGENRLWLLTGPNMAGKSTFLRQNALIAVLAQMGSYVPVGSARIGIVDQLFSRVGAADDLARGRSTFMVEMVETAAILNQAGPRSLVILDEIGRGTATFDGLSIAWASVEHLQRVNACRALFATHYHELTALAGQLEGVRNAAMRVTEWEGDIVFMHEVSEGAASRSYGVQVAKLAGLPEAVIARAREVLNTLEKGDLEGGKRMSLLMDDLPLFSGAPPTDTAKAIEPARSSVLDELREVNPDELTPRAALDVLYKLKALLD